VRGLFILIAAVLALSPASAWACPSCALREGPGVGILLAVAAMIAAPYLVALVAIRVVRRLERKP